MGLESLERIRAATAGATSKGGRQVTVGFVAYPMVDEAAATGRVAAVYAEILAVMPMVPSLFKSLAVCPPYLVLAWRQSEAVLANGRADEAGAVLVSTVRGVTPPPVVPRLRDELARFVGPLGRMLFVAAGLRVALDGSVEARPADARIAPRSSAPAPELDVPGQDAVGDTGSFDAIRGALSTPIVNSLWRHLAGLGLLASAWDGLAPHVDRAIEAGEALADQARDVAEATDWPVAASPAALQAARCADAAAGMGAVLDAYVVTLPRVLALVAGCVSEPAPTTRIGGASAPEDTVS